MRHVNPVDLKMCNECNALIAGIHLNTTMHHCSGQPPNQLAKFSHGFLTQKNTFRSKHCLGRGKDWHRLAMAKSLPGHNSRQFLIEKG